MRTCNNELDRRSIQLPDPRHARCTRRLRACASSEWCHNPLTKSPWSGGAMTFAEQASTTGRSRRRTSVATRVGSRAGPHMWTHWTPWTIFSWLSLEHASPHPIQRATMSPSSSAARQPPQNTVRTVLGVQLHRAGRTAADADVAGSGSDKLPENSRLDRQTGFAPAGSDASLLPGSTNSRRTA